MPAEQPEEIADEIVRINTESGDLALQAAMLIPVHACLLGFANSCRMMRLPDYPPPDAEGMLGG